MFLFSFFCLFLERSMGCGSARKNGTNPPKIKSRGAHHKNHWTTTTSMIQEDDQINAHQPITTTHKIDAHIIYHYVINISPCKLSFLN
jgi:hypothetical protein